VSLDRHPRLSLRGNKWNSLFMLEHECAIRAYVYFVLTACASSGYIFDIFTKARTSPRMRRLSSAEREKIWN